MAERQRKLKIQTGVVKRIAKEKVMYEEEAVGIAEKISKMEDAGGDEYVIKKQKEVLAESKQMGPDCQKRLEQAIEVLSGLVETEKDLEETEEYQNAVNQLNEVK
ncbi:tubulin-specific chaperone A-like [Styela clava]